ncbi:MAG: UDP-glucose 4-epimerase, partial [Moorea sp. SIO2I5]|nr:UDP-glucose 4-epimerase [Moorena sp. SIO2I5]
QIVGHPIKKNYIEKAKGDARHTAADITKAKTLLSYQPQVSLSQGLAQEWEWIQNLYACV